ncbi:hypothetical protein TNCV_3240981 [Trichonephila clavipes]|nr:hypothetical protein TNCV_3240981 [Trichonephila clavipes]
MNPNYFICDNGLEAPLICNWNGSSSQVSQPLASLETRLQNLSLTAPVSTPEVSSLHEKSASYFQHFLYKRMENQSVAHQSRGCKPVSTPEVSSLHEDSSAYPQHFLCKSMENLIVDRRSRRWKPERDPFYFRSGRERFLQIKEYVTARTSQYCMGSTSSMPSFPGAYHEVYGGENRQNQRNVLDCVLGCDSRMVDSSPWKNSCVGH